MRGHNGKILGLGLLVLVLSTVAGCSFFKPAIALYDQISYENAVSLKIESLALMDKATEPYDNHKAEVNRLILAIEEAHKHSARIGDANKLSTAQWDIIKKPEGNSVVGFMKRWESQGSLNAVFIREAKGELAGHFDEIITLEAAKIRKEQD